MVQSSADIDKEPNETSKRDSVLTLVSYVFPSNSSSNSSPRSTNTFENQTGHSVGCQRVRSNKNPQRTAPHSLLSSVRSSFFMLTVGYPLCQSSPWKSSDSCSLQLRMTLLYLDWMTSSMLCVHLASSVSFSLWYFQHQEFSLTLAIVFTHLVFRHWAVVSFESKG